jgi:hypothetical protein
LPRFFQGWSFDRRPDGLLSGIGRKTGWLMAEQAGLERPYRMQSLLGRSQWSEDGLRDAVRSYVIETLGDADGVLIVDETGFVKKGTSSAGVARQYSGTAGRIENSQIGVFLAYASRFGQAPIDRRLYLTYTSTERCLRPLQKTLTCATVVTRLGKVSIHGESAAAFADTRIRAFVQIWHLGPGFAEAATFTLVSKAKHDLTYFSDGAPVMPLFRRAASRAVYLYIGRLCLGRCRPSNSV